ncbi:hypothetical protein NC651_017242 [Populus alba x Populus x berolinensis]|nr:hypothetical protein NC651_017242 [Populus alba x Populus x berolinensis]
MASIVRLKPVILLLFVQLCLSLLSPSLAITFGSSGDGYAINGRVKIPGIGTKGLGGHGKLSNVKVLLNGGQHVTFLRPDGYFSLYPAVFLTSSVHAGTHLIEVDAIGYFFSPVRVDVSARFPGKVQATLTEKRRSLSEMVLEPLKEEQYYEGTLLHNVYRQKSDGSHDGIYGVGYVHNAKINGKHGPGRNEESSRRNEKPRGSIPSKHIARSCKEQLEIKSQPSIPNVAQRHSLGICSGNGFGKSILTELATLDLPSLSRSRFVVCDECTLPLTKSELRYNGYKKPHISVMNLNPMRTEEKSFMFHPS